MWDHFPPVPFCPSPGSRLEPLDAYSITPLTPLVAHLDQTCLWVFQNTGVFQNLLLWPTDDSYPGHICPGPGGCSFCQKKKCSFSTASYLACHSEPGLSPSKRRLEALQVPLRYELWKLWKLWKPTCLQNPQWEIQPLKDCGPRSW